MQNQKQPIHPSNMYGFRQISNEILRQTVVVKCPDARHGIMLFIFLNAADELAVSALFEQVGLRTSIPQNYSALAGYLENYCFEYCMELSRSAINLFNVSSHLQVQKHELGGFIIAKENNPGGDDVVKNLARGLYIIGRSESKTIPMRHQNPVTCTAYFSR